MRGSKTESRILYMGRFLASTNHVVLTRINSDVWWLQNYYVPLHQINLNSPLITIYSLIFWFPIDTLLRGQSMPV